MLESTRMPISWQGLSGPNGRARSRWGARPALGRSPRIDMPADRYARVLINETLRRGEDVASGGPTKVTRKETLNLSSSEVELRLFGLGWVVTNATARLVGALRPQDHELLRPHDPLGVHAGTTTLVTDGEHLGHILGSVAESRDGLEGPSQVVGVE